MRLILVLLCCLICIPVLLLVLCSVGFGIGSAFVGLITGIGGAAVGLITGLAGVFVGIFAGILGPVMVLAIPILVIAGLIRLLNAR